jgi:hypothetical protein
LPPESYTVKTAAQQKSRSLSEVAAIHKQNRSTERRQLEHFAAVVEGRHFTWAADLLLTSSG